MPILDCIFVNTGRHPEAEALICKATGSLYSHAATRFEVEGEKIIVEAVRPAVRVVTGDFFDDCETIQIISLPITEEQRRAVVKRALELVGKAYGIDDCLIAGANDVFGGRIAEILDCMNNDDTYNCSGAQTEIIRAAFPKYAQGVNSSRITPEKARLMVLELTKGLEVS